VQRDAGASGKLRNEADGPIWGILITDEPIENISQMGR